MKDIKIFLLVILLFLIQTFLLDRMASHVVRKMFLRSSDELRYAYNNSDDHIVILGSSRAKHYNTDMLSNLLGDSIKCYSYGSGGQNIYYHYAVLNTILENNTPNLVICDLMDIDVKRTSELYSTAKLSQLYPLYDLNDTVKRVVSMQGNKVNALLSMAKLYHYNSKIPKYFYDLFQNNSKYTAYKGLTGVITAEREYVKKSISFEYDSLKLNFVQRLIDVCNNRNIKLIIIVSPVYIKYEKNISPLYMALNNLKYGEHCKFWYYEQDSIFINNKYLFYDKVHLNSVGVDLFTLKLIKKINEDTLIFNK